MFKKLFINYIKKSLVERKTKREVIASGGIRALLVLILDLFARF